MRTFFCCITLTVCLAAPTLAQGTRSTPARRTSPPSAQGGRVFVALNGGYQSASHNLTDTHEVPVFQETMSWTADYKVRNAPAFGGDLGVRLWRGLGLSVGLSRFQDDRGAGITGQVPHPFFFEQPRPLSGDSTSLGYSEQAIHAGLFWVIPAGRRAQVMLSAGPSFFSVDRDLAQEITYSDTYPYNEVTFQKAVTRRVSESATGFNAGADFGYFFTRGVGLGAGFRFTAGQVDFASPAGGTSLSMDVGGAQANVGVRLRFGR